MKTLLANIIFTLHLCLIIFILVTPFYTDKIIVLTLHIISVISLILHWKLNDDVCILTLIEGYLRNVNYKDGFIHQFVGPVYNHNSDLSHKMCLILILISIIQLKRKLEIKYLKYYQYIDNWYKKREYSKIIMLLFIS